MTTRKICYTAMGIALFVVFTLALQVPVFENYYLCLGYIAMAVYIYYYGIISGTLVGTIGVIIYCMLTGGVRGMPGWIFGNVAIAIGCGLAVRFTGKYKNVWLKQLIMGVAVILSTAIGILILKSLVEVVLYAIPFMVRVASNLFAYIADVVVLILGFSICINGEKILRKQFEE